jgi:hypothetical protein
MYPQCPAPDFLETKVLAVIWVLSLEFGTDAMKRTGRTLHQFCE